MVVIAGFLLFIFGSAIGSFLNVVVVRYNPARSLFSFKELLGRSHCPSCKKVLGVFELIPLMSFFFLRGKCRKCKTHISWQYPFIEFLSGCVFFFVPFFLSSFYNISFSSFLLFLSPLWYYAFAGLWIIAFLTFLLVAVIDIREYVIPDELNIILGILGICMATILSFHITSLPAFSSSFLRHYSLIFSSIENLFVLRLLGGLMTGIFFLSLVYITRGRGMGMGDVKFMAAAGILFGWPDILIGTLFGFIVGGVGALFLFMSGTRGMKDRIPFGPFLVFGLILLFFIGFPVINWYFSILG